MLSDDSPTIAHLALSTPLALSTLPPALLADQCRDLIAKKGKTWRKVREGGVAALTGDLIERCQKETVNLALSVCLPLILLPKCHSDLVLAKVVLRSKLVGKSAFLSALKREVAAYLSADGKVKDYSAKVWVTVPRIIAGMSATQQVNLWSLLEGVKEGDQTSEVMQSDLVLTLALLHAGLGTHGVKGHAGVKLAHRMMDVCLRVLEQGKVRSGEVRKGQVRLGWVR